MPSNLTETQSVSSKEALESYISDYLNILSRKLISVDVEQGDTTRLVNLIFIMNAAINNDYDYADIDHEIKFIYHSDGLRDIRDALINIVQISRNTYTDNENKLYIELKDQIHLLNPEAEEESYKDSFRLSTSSVIGKFIESHHHVKLLSEQLQQAREEIKNLQSPGLSVLEASSEECFLSKDRESFGK
ncbi:MAG: hypothetical protein ACI9IL_000159 [Rickettsiales bacterium]|jgi:hypothetical protein